MLQFLDAAIGEQIAGRAGMAETILYVAGEHHVVQGSWRGTRREIERWKEGSRG